MRKIFFYVLAMLLALCCLIVGCDNPANSGDENDYKQKGPAIANWFEYTTSTPTGDGWYTKQTSIFYINTDGKIERAGSESYEYFGTELEMIQNTLSWSICYENSNNIGLHVTFKITEPPVWADNTSDDNSNNDLKIEDGNDNNSSSSDNNNNNENDIPSEDNKPEIILPTGYEWWCFEEADLQGDYYFLYFNNTLVRMGLYSVEFDVEQYFPIFGDKETAISNFMGNKYQITDLTKLPAWALN